MSRACFRAGATTKRGRSGNRAAPFLCWPKWYFDGMRKTFLLSALFFTACGEDRPPAPTTEENRQLDEAEAMLNEVGNETEPVRTAR